MWWSHWIWVSSSSKSCFLSWTSKTIRYGNDTFNHRLAEPRTLSFQPPRTPRPSRPLNSEAEDFRWRDITSVSKSRLSFEPRALAPSSGPEEDLTLPIRDKWQRNPLVGRRRCSSQAPPVENRTFAESETHIGKESARNVGDVRRRRPGFCPARKAGSNPGSGLLAH